MHRVAYLFSKFGKKWVRSTSTRLRPVPPLPMVMIPNFTKSTSDSSSFNNPYPTDQDEPSELSIARKQISRSLQSIVSILLLTLPYYLLVEQSMALVSLLLSLGHHLFENKFWHSVFYIVKVTTKNISSLFKLFFNNLFKWVQLKSLIIP